MAQTKKTPKSAGAKPKADGGNKVFSDLRTRTDDQLSDQLVELKREQFNLRFQAATNQLEKPSRVREVRRTIARIKTLQSARASEAAKA